VGRVHRKRIQAYGQLVKSKVIVLYNDLVTGACADERIAYVVFVFW
jgi:hypothetical protein